MEALTVCLNLLGIEKKILLTTEYNKKAGKPVEELIDKRSLVHPKRQMEGIEIKYTQVFGREFVPNMSIIDLIFNEGPNAKAILRSAVG